MGCGSRKLETYFYAALKELQSKLFITMQVVRPIVS